MRRVNITIKFFNGTISPTMPLCPLGLIFVTSILLKGRLGMQLCGREFIRAVIFTCGGSRWRRGSGSNMLSSSSSSFIIYDYRRFCDIYHPHLSLFSLLLPHNCPSSALSGSTELSMDHRAAEWPGNTAHLVVAQMREVDKSRRITGKARQHGISGHCCRWGCSKAELSLLC
uniref:Relaxin 3b n=1 Tax=Eptatretus burgeri TaxID=7764 RepID=A0A8C4Q1E0_EPTBU